MAEQVAQELTIKLTTVLHFREKIFLSQGIARVETVQSVITNLQDKVLKSIFHFSTCPPPHNPAWFRLYCTGLELLAPAELTQSLSLSRMVLIICEDLFSHDDMFSNIYKIQEIADGLCLEAEGKTVSRTERNLGDSLVGGDLSAEGWEGTESSVIPGVETVMNHPLQETDFTKEAYRKYIKDYTKSTKGKLEEQRTEMTGATERIKHILANLKNYQFFIGENVNPDGMAALAGLLRRW